MCRGDAVRVGGLVLGGGATIKRVNNEDVVIRKRYRVVSALLFILQATLDAEGFLGGGVGAGHIDSPKRKVTERSHGWRNAIQDCVVKVLYLDPWQKLGEKRVANFLESRAMPDNVDNVGIKLAAKIADSGVGVADFAEQHFVPCCALLDEPQEAGFSSRVLLLGRVCDSPVDVVQILREPPLVSVGKGAGLSSNTRNHRVEVLKGTLENIGARPPRLMNVEVAVDSNTFFETLDEQAPD